MDAKYLLLFNNNKETNPFTIDLFPYKRAKNEAFENFFEVSESLIWICFSHKFTHSHN